MSSGRMGAANRANRQEEWGRDPREPEEIERGWKEFPNHLDVAVIVKGVGIIASNAVLREYCEGIAEPFVGCGLIYLFGRHYTMQWVQKEVHVVVCWRAIGPGGPLVFLISPTLPRP